MSAGWQGNAAKFDLTADGKVDHSDLEYLIEQLLGTSFGDANLDGIFNSSDLVEVLQSGEFEDLTPGNSNWAEGDWDCDGDFLTADLVLAFQSGQYVAAAVPGSAALPRSPRCTTISARLTPCVLNWPTNRCRIPLHGRRHALANRLGQPWNLAAGGPAYQDPPRGR